MTQITHLLKNIQSYKIKLRLLVTKNRKRGLQNCEDKMKDRR